MAEETIEIPSMLGATLPDQGNTKVDPNKPLGSETQPGGNDLTPAEKLIVAEREIKAREEKLKADAEAKLKEEKDKGGKTDEDEVDDLTQEQIDAKLSEIEKKDQAELTDEEKEFVKANTPVELISSIKTDIETTYGVQLGEKYENNGDGLKQLANDLAPKLGEQTMLNHFDTVPYMREFYNHVVVEGKGIETFLAKNEKPAFEAIKVENPNDVEEAQKPTVLGNLKLLVTLNLKAKGMSDEDVKTITDLYESNGTLLDKAKASKEELQKSHKANLDAMLKAEELRIQQEEAIVQGEYKKIEEMITKNEINGVSLPVADLKSFREAMLKPIDQRGTTLMDIKRDKLTTEQRVLIDYIVFKGFKVTGLTTKAKNPSFDFKKLGEENDKRKGGRLNGGKGDNGNETSKGHPNINIRDTNFGMLNNIEKQTIN